MWIHVLPRRRPAPAGSFRTVVVVGLLLAAASAGTLADPADSTASPELAVLPLQNRTDGPAPEEEIRQDLVSQLSLVGVTVLDDATLEAFLRRHRMRWVGGINRAQAEALQEETGVAGVVVSSLDLFHESNPPRVALTSRLVSTGPDPRIRWMDSFAVAGDESPGFLGLGLVDDVQTLLQREIPTLAASLSAALGHVDIPAGQEKRLARKPHRRFLPKVAFRSPDVAILGGAGARVALLPLANGSGLPYAGEIVTDQVLLDLVNAGVDVLETGIVRQTLLENRLIQPDGPSLPQSDVLHASLDVDRILFGEVAEYQEAGGGTLDALVDFSIRALDTSSRQVIWSSISHTTGNEGVFFFDVGRIATAHELTSRMAGALVAQLDRPAGGRKPKGGIPQ